MKIQITHLQLIYIFFKGNNLESRNFMSYVLINKIHLKNYFFSPKDSKLNKHLLNIENQLITIS